MRSTLYLLYYLLLIIILQTEYNYPHDIYENISPKEVIYFIQVHTATKWQKQDSNTGLGLFDFKEYNFNH